MITELEQEFFKVFGIEPKKLFSARQDINPDAVFYPEITDHKLLQMICILNKEAVYGYYDWNCKLIIGETIEELKQSILTDCIMNKSKVFKQIQQLFKEEE